MIRMGPVEGLRGLGDGGRARSQGDGYVTPPPIRPVDGVQGFSKDGYPVTPEGRPPPGPPPQSPRQAFGRGVGFQVQGVQAPERPEEPAKYIYELPKLVAAEISSSAVVCGNWMAQTRQIFAGLSPTAMTWWSSVEQAASIRYQRWLTADTLDRLLLDPTTAVASFDAVKYQRVESRAVSLILASVPANVREEAVSNRWLTSAALLFRIQCLYQPGGSTERAMLLSHLVSPEAVKSLGAGVVLLRKWVQNFNRVRELQASLPDSSLLLKGVDNATAHILAQNPLVGFRVNAFRNRVSLDYNPSISSVLQLVRLLQAEFEAAALSVDSPQADRRRAAALQTPTPPEPPPPKSVPGPPSAGQAKALAGDEASKGKGKGKDRAKSEGDGSLCYNFADGKGCKFGDSCKFKHDRAAARRLKRCLACGQEGHFRPECPLVPPELRAVQDPSSPQSGSPSAAAAKGPPPKRFAVPKPKVAPQAKGITEDSMPGASEGSGEAGTEAREALMAEAARLLKGVCLSRSGAGRTGHRSGTLHALRPAQSDELGRSKVIKVDLASGVAELHVNRQGTLLSAAPCQVILPAGYLVQMGYSITWKKGNCVVKKKGGRPLEVKLVKGCPLLPRDVGLQLLEEYEDGLEKGELTALRPLLLKRGVEDFAEGSRPRGLCAQESRRWLMHRVWEGSLSRRD